MEWGNPPPLDIPGYVPPWIGGFDLGGGSNIMGGFTQVGPGISIGSILGAAVSNLPSIIRRGVPAVRTPSQVPSLPIPGVGQPPYDLTRLPGMQNFRFGRVGARHMNVCNMKALSRALRRITAFEKKARKVLTITTGKKCGVRMKMKRKRSCR